MPQSSFLRDTRGRIKGCSRGGGWEDRGLPKAAALPGGGFGQQSQLPIKAARPPPPPVKRKHPCSGDHPRLGGGTETSSRTPLLEETWRPPPCFLFQLKPPEAAGHLRVRLEGLGVSPPLAEAGTSRGS